LGSSRTDSYRNILAITFTNKAAEEMKSRVLETLDQLASDSTEEHAMTSVLRSEIGLSNSELSTRATSVLKHMLHNYSDISISTIDHFTHNVIRTFSQDLGLSVNFQVELDNDVLKQEVIDLLFQSVGQDKILTNALIDLAQSQADDEKSWTLDDKLNQFMSVLFSEESRFHLDQLKNIELKEFHALRINLKARISKKDKRLRAIGTDLQKQLEQSGLNSGCFFQGDRGILGVFKSAAKGIAKELNSYVTATIEQDK